MVPNKVTMTVREAGPATSTIDIRGEMSAFAEDELMMAYAEATGAYAAAVGAYAEATGAYAAATGDNTKTVILNFSDVSYMNSSGIGPLVTLLIRANRNGHALLAYGLNEHYRRVFELTKLNEAIRVFDDEAAALTAAEAAQHTLR